MRLMAMPAMRLSLAETRGAPKRLHDEGRFAKPAVLEESPAREVAVWLAQVSREECGTLGGVIHLALRGLAGAEPTARGTARKSRRTRARWRGGNPRAPG